MAAGRTCGVGVLAGSAAYLLGHLLAWWRPYLSGSPNEQAGAAWEMARTWTPLLRRTARTCWWAG